MLPKYTSAEHVVDAVAEQLVKLLFCIRVPEVQTAFPSGPCFVVSACLPDSLGLTVFLVTLKWQDWYATAVSFLSCLFSSSLMSFLSFSIFEVLGE